MALNGNCTHKVTQDEILSNWIEKVIENYYWVESPYLIVCTISTILNTLVVLTVVIFKQYKNHFKRLTTAIAIGDLAYSIVEIVLISSKISSTANHTVCLGVNSFNRLVANIECGIILIIGLERYYCIACPFNKLSRGIIHVLELMNIIAAVLSLLPLFVYGCRNAETYLIFNWLDVTIYLILPTIIMTFLLTKTIIALKKRLDNGVQSLHHQRVKESQRVVLILFFVLTFFIGFTAPWRIVEILPYHFDNDVVSKAQIVMICTYVFHTITNPIIYSVIDPRWQRDVKKLAKKILPNCFQLDRDCNVNAVTLTYFSKRTMKVDILEVSQI